MSNPILNMLVGLPASGKSTFVNFHILKNDIVLSSDYYIDKFCEANNKTYSEGFKEYADAATKLMYEKAEFAFLNGYDIFWDQTNLNKKTRKNKINQFKKYIDLNNYKIICYVFETPKNHVDILKSRTGKDIPYYVIENMIRGYEEPSLDEGFDEIIFINMFK